MTNLETLKLYQAWRRNDDDEAVSMLELGLSPKSIGEALNWAIRELDTPDWVQSGDNTLHGAIDHWQGEASRLKAENEALRVERDVLSTAKTQLKITLSQLQQAIDQTEKYVEELEVERDGLAARSRRLEVEMMDVASAATRKEACMIASAVIDELPSISLARVKAAGAREALQRAMQTPGFSDTVVRVDALQAVIEQMEIGK